MAKVVILPRVDLPQNIIGQGLLDFVQLVQIQGDILEPIRTGHERTGTIGEHVTSRFVTHVADDLHEDVFFANLLAVQLVGDLRVFASRLEGGVGDILAFHEKQIIVMTVKMPVSVVNGPQSALYTKVLFCRNDFDIRHQLTPNVSGPGLRNRIIKPFDQFANKCTVQVDLAPYSCLGRI